MRFAHCVVLSMLKSALKRSNQPFCLREFVVGTKLTYPAVHLYLGPTGLKTDYFSIKFAGLSQTDDGNQVAKYNFHK